MPERPQRTLGATADVIAAQAAELGVPLDPAQTERLITFANLLLRWNRAFNLVSRQDTDRLLPRHLLDSLSVADWLTGPSVLDLGTGAGLPGLPLAIARADLQFTLVDRHARKIRFVAQAARTLELDNVQALCLDAAELAPSRRFDTVLCRAVAEPAAIWSLAEPLMQARGRLLIMRHGQRPARPWRDDRAEPTDTASDLAGVRLSARVDLHIPGLSQPHELLVLERDA